MAIKNRGISIVETIVALMILATIGAALVALNVKIQSVSNSAKFKSLAEAQAQQMIEQVREKRVQGGIGDLGVGCYSNGDLESAPSAPVCVCNSASKYIDIRDVTNGKKVTSIVGRIEKGKVYCTTVVTYLYDY